MDFFTRNYINTPYFFLQVSWAFIKKSCQLNSLRLIRFYICSSLAYSTLSFVAYKFFILASLIKLFIFPFKVLSYWCHKSINDQTSLSFWTIHLAVTWIIKIPGLRRATFFYAGFHCCHTEQRVAICCTLPMSIRSCLMWRLSWGSLVRGSGGSNSPVKSSQLSRTKWEKRTNLNGKTIVYSSGWRSHGDRVHFPFPRRPIYTSRVWEV